MIGERIVVVEWVVRGRIGVEMCGVDGRFWEEGIEGIW